MKIKKVMIMLATILATSSSANASGFNFDLGKMLESKLKAQTQYELVVPRDAAELRHKEAIKLYEDVAVVAYKKHWNIIIESPSSAQGKKIYSVIQNKQRNVALEKGRGNKFMTKQALTKVSKMKMRKGHVYKILLRSKGISTGDEI